MPAADVPKTEFDVIVVGCGPVGAVAATLLARRGLKVLVVEQAPAPHPLPRAVHIDHEMMRIFQSLDLVAALEPLMRATDGHVHIGADGGVIRYLGAKGRPKRFGWANDYFFYQPELEAVLRADLIANPNATLRLGVTFVDLTQDRDAVRVTLEGDGRPEQATARYLIACDGARSAVRKRLAIQLDDLAFEEPWLVIDAEVDGPIRFPEFAGLPAGADLQNLSVMLCDPKRPATVVPGRGRHRRWEFMLLPGEADQEMMRAETVQALIAPWVAGSSYRIVRAATYRFHGLVARRWRQGRVFLAGDAAHQTPPFFGQGMCHGLRDAVNLAWKLDLVLGGRAGDPLLDTYQVERDPHVRTVIDAALSAGRYICLLDPAAATARDVALREAMGTGAPATAADLIPPLAAGVVAAVGERFIQPRVSDGAGGERLLDAVLPAGFRLLSRSLEVLQALQGDGAAVWAELDGQSRLVGVEALGRHRAVKDLYGDLDAWLTAHDCEAVLLRPDSYVYGVASTSDELAALLDRLASDIHLKRRGAAVQPRRSGETPAMEAAAR